MSSKSGFAKEKDPFGDGDTEPGGIKFLLTKKQEVSNLKRSQGSEELAEEDTSNQRTSTPNKMVRENLLGAGDASSIVYEGQDISNMMSTSAILIDQDQDFSSSLEQDNSGMDKSQDHSRSSGGSDRSQDNSGILKKSGLDERSARTGSSNRSVTFALEPEIIEDTDDLSRYFNDFENPGGVSELLSDEDGSIDGGVDASEFNFSSHRNTRMLLTGYFFAVFILLFNKVRWIADEFRAGGDGHLVSKTLVILLLVYTYSFINWGMESIRAGDCVLELFCPVEFYRAKDWLKNFIRKHPKLMYFRDAKVLLPSLFTKIGLFFWNKMWKNYICKSAHDQSCRMTSFGRWLYDYRNKACYDGLASSVICERFLSYLPLIIITCFVVLFGNLISPFICDCLENYLNNVRKEVTKEHKEMFEKLVQDRKLEANRVLTLNKPKPQRKIVPHSETLNSSIYEVKHDNSKSSDGTLNTGFLDQTEDSIRKRRGFGVKEDLKSQILGDHNETYASEGILNAGFLDQSEYSFEKEEVD